MYCEYCLNYNTLSKYLIDKSFSAKISLQTAKINILTVLAAESYINLHLSLIKYSIIAQSQTILN